MLLCLKQPDFGSAVVLLLPHVHAALRRGREGRLHPRRVDPRRGVRRGRRSASARTATSATSRGSTWTSTGRTSRTSRSSRVMSFGSGGPSGLGLGHGLQTLYLPEAHTDFIAAIIGEELGFVGVARALRARTSLLVVARRARGARARRTTTAAYLAFGISTMFGVQALVNLAVALAHPADQGPHAAVRQLRRLVAARERGGGGHPAQHLAPAPATRRATPTDARRARRARRAPTRRGERRAGAEEALVSVTAILIAGGGTGGHVFPVLAVADALRAAAPTCDVVFVGTPRGHRGARRPGARLTRSSCSTSRRMQGGGAARALRGGARRAPRRDRRRRARSCGGSRPRAVLSRRRLRGRARSRSRRAPRRAARDPRAEQRRSASPTASLAPFAKRAYVACPETRARASAPSIVRRCRRAAARAASRPRRTRRGASRARPRARRQPGRAGAQRAPCPTALAARVGARARRSRSCTRPGADRDAAVRDAYARARASRARRCVPFIDDVAARARRAPIVVVARAGAVDASPRSAPSGAPSILVPFPFAADDHQAQERRGARARAAAPICDPPGRRPTPRAPRAPRSARSLARRRRAASRMADAARAHGRPDAADDVARDLLELAAIARARRGSARSGIRPTASPGRPLPRHATATPARRLADVPRSRPSRALRRHRRHRHERPRRDPAHARVRRVRLGPASRTTSRGASRRSACASTSATAPRTSHGADVVVYSSAIAPRQPRARARARARDPRSSRAPRCSPS